MAILSNILDALRRVGSPSAKSALRRQDSQLEGRTVIERGRRTVRVNGELVQGFHAVVEPCLEEISALNEEDFAQMSRNASLASSVFAAFGVDTIPEPLDQLDKAFEEWQRASDKRGYSGDAIMEILGAFFGEYCNATLGMRWITVSDQYGVCVAVNGIDAEFRAFPYHSIAKRIADSEHTFFRGIYMLLLDQKQHSSVRKPAAF